MAQREIHVSVDVETSGSVPGLHDLLSIGAVDVDDASRFFSIDLKPASGRFEQAAMDVVGRPLSEFEAVGTPIPEAMAAFAAWAESLRGGGEKLVFVGLNAPFDWSFVNYGFFACALRNPFGHKALDINAYWMGLTGCTWAETGSSAIDAATNPLLKGTHDALDDARYQAEIFRIMRDRRSEFVRA